MKIGLVAVALIAILASACNREPNTPAPLSRDKVNDLRAAFNAGAAGPRVVVFFSSGCAACDTGSRALQKTLETIDGPVTIIGVWEPIFETDPAPTPKLFGNNEGWAAVTRFWILDSGSAQGTSTADHK
jgi:hypothetical protein